MSTPKQRQAAMPARRREFQLGFGCASVQRGRKRAREAAAERASDASLVSPAARLLLLRGAPELFHAAPLPADGFQLLLERLGGGADLFAVAGKGVWGRERLFEAARQ